MMPQNTYTFESLNLWVLLLCKKYPCRCEEVKVLEMETYLSRLSMHQKCLYMIEAEGDLTCREGVRKTE